MTRLRVLPAITLVLLLCLGAQQGIAQVHRLSVHVARGPVKGATHPQRFNELFQLSQGMGVLPPLDGGGADEWPCFGGNADCPDIATGGVVIGTPAYTWSYAACDANNPSATNCGQIFWFYEDDTGDTTDHLIVQIVAKQGSNTVLNTGPYDFGPNPFGGSPGIVVVVSDDAAFGTLGQTGKGNGYCYDPQLTKQRYTCADPFAGPVTINVTTTVGPSRIHGGFTVNLQ